SPPGSGRRIGRPRSRARVPRAAMRPEASPPAEERNALHQFAQDVREKGTVGAVIETVRQNPLLLLPGGSVLMVAKHAFLSDGGAEGDQQPVGAGQAAIGAQPACGFDLGSALEPRQ
ncbi:unnamed protein product, partial [Prorocentrum cordatum]